MWFELLFFYNIFILFLKSLTNVFPKVFESNDVFKAQSGKVIVPPFMCNTFKVYWSILNYVLFNHRMKGEVCSHLLYPYFDVYVDFVEPRHLQLLVILASLVNILSKKIKNPSNITAYLNSSLFSYYYTKWSSLSSPYLLLLSYSCKNVCDRWVASTFPCVADPIIPWWGRERSSTLLNNWARKSIIEFQLFLRNFYVSNPS